MSNQNPILLVTGIRKAQGSFQDGAKNIDYSNTVVTVLTDYSDKEKEQGAIGFKSTEHKIKGAQFFQDYIHQQLPAKAELVFHWDFTGKTPKAELLKLNFDSELVKQYESKVSGKTYEKSTV